MAEDYNIEELKKLYSIQNNEEFKNYLNTAILTLTTGKNATLEKTLVIVGGQSGAGKSKLIPVTLNELQSNAVVVDFDELRALHPHYSEVTEKYPEKV